VKRQRLPRPGRSHPGSRAKLGSLRGKIALVTGASQGLGFAIADALAAAGCSLAICSRNQAKLSRAARKLSRHKVRILPFVCDVTDSAAVQTFLAEVKRTFRRLDMLINNAGVSQAYSSVPELPPEKWSEVIGANLTGLFYVTRAALPLMKPGGAILNILSIAAIRNFPQFAAYNAAKHGARALTTALREELRPQRIRVIAVMPGAVDTAIWEQFWPEAPREKMMKPVTVAQALVNALALPEDAIVEELTIRPSVGTL
jgi:NAD(P)-dependent dehydrogenase (short-subunit alcohol dehydrogenase family)